MKRQERSASIHETALQLKPEKILFRPLAEKSSTLAPSATEPAGGGKRPPTLSSAEDLVDTNKTISDKWMTLYPQFPEIEKFDHKSIVNYGNEDEEALEKKCVQACIFFDLVVQTLASEAATLSNKTVKEDLLKIFVVTFQKVTYSLLMLVISTNEDKEPTAEQLSALAGLLKRRETLNNFLLLILQDRKNSSTLSQHDTTLMQIVRETVNQLHERLANVQKIRSVPTVAYYLYYHFQAIAILAAFNETRSFMKNAAYDCIRLAFETLERSLRAALSSASLREVYSLPINGGETWISGSQLHLKLAVQYGKKKLALVQLRPGAETAPLFSLRYINTYYALKLTQMMIARKIFTFEERTLETVAVVLKDTSDLLTQVLTGAKSEPKEDQLARIEIALNEDLVCFNIIKRILPNVDDPFAILEKLGYTRLVKGVVENHLALALRLRLVAYPYAPHEPHREVLAVEEEVSYKKVHDYVAGVFNFINRLKNTKSSKTQKTALKTSKASIATLTEEILGDIISSIDSVVTVEPELLMLKTYIVEHLFDSRQTVSRQAAEHIIRLVGSNAFHFTSPKTLKELETTGPTRAEDELDKLNNRRIATLLNEIIAYDKTWAETILRHMMGQIKVLYTKEEQLFGLYKLIYCALTNEVHDNFSFAAKLIRAQPVPLTHALYLEYEPRAENKAVLAFIETKGIAEIVNILQVTYKAIMLQPQSVDLRQPLSMSAHMTEQLFLLLNNIPAVSDQVLKSPALAVEFLEFFSLGPHIQTVIVNFMQKLLATVKYANTRPQGMLTTVTDQTARGIYLPLRLLDFIKDKTKEGREEQAMAVIPLLELLVRFVEPETNVQSLSVHQSTLNSSSALEVFFRIVEDSRHTPLVGQMLGLFLRFLGGLQSHNDAVASEVSGSKLIARKGLYSFIKEEISKNLLKSEEVEQTLVLLLEIVFETKVDLGNSARYLIKRQFFFLTYLSLLSYLAVRAEWKARVALHCGYIVETVQNSYWNYSICARFRVFKKFLKLMNRFSDSPETLRRLSNLATATISVNGSSNCLKAFISQLGVLNSPALDPAAQQAHVSAILDSLLRALTAEAHREVFSFSGKPGCGIGLLARKTLPKEGYCFCGWIRVERADQSAAERDGRMTIFKLGASKDREIELFFKDGFLHYSMADIKAKEQAHVTTFSQKKLEEDLWYFVELYHLNNESSKSLILYLNGELVKESLCKPYQAKLDYDENTIGCGVQLEYVGKQGEEKIKNCFRGEMSALYFIEAAPKTVVQMHKMLAYVSMNINMDDLVHAFNKYQSMDGRKHSAGGKSGKGGHPAEAIDPAVIDHIFMHINPKYTGKISQSKQRLYVYCKGGSKSGADVFNHVERLYQEARIDHNTPARDAFLNIGGIKTLMPLLHRLVETKSAAERHDFANATSTKVLEIIDHVVRLDPQRAVIFFETEEGLLILRHLLTRISKKSGGFGTSFCERAMALLSTFDEHYPVLSEQYIETILLNGDLWSESSSAIQLSIITCVHARLKTCTPASTSKILDSFLNALELYLNQDNENTTVVQKLVEVITHILREHLTEENINKLIGYANLCYIHKRPNYLLQLYHVLRIVLELYLVCREKFMKELKATIKARHDSNVLATLAVALRHCLISTDAKEEGWSATAKEEDKTKDTVSDTKSQKCEDVVCEYTKSPEKELILDSVRAIAIYILGSFEWSALSDFVKEFIREESLPTTVSAAGKTTVPSPALAMASAAQALRTQQDVVGCLVKSLSKSKLADNMVLEAFFADSVPGLPSIPASPGQRRPVGIATYLALSSLAMDNPGKLAAFYKISLPHHGKDDKAIRSLPMYELMLRQAGKRFAPEACKELANDLSLIWGKDSKLSKEVQENSSLLASLFELSATCEDPRVAKIQADLLCSLSPAMQRQAWTHMRGSPVYRVSVLSDALHHTLLQVSALKGSDKHSDKAGAKCILYAYAMEDILTFDCTVASTKEFVQAAGRLVLLADKLNIMYVSVPTLTWMDERVVSVPRWEERSPSEIHESTIIQREGGVLRVLLKVLLLALKYDTTRDVVTGVLFRYLILREKSDRKLIKEVLGLKPAKDAKSKAKSKHPTLVSLLDIVLKKDKDAIAQHNSSTEFYLKKVIGNDTSVLDSRKVSKSVAQFPKEKSLFELSSAVIMYIFGELFHLMHFELFGITTYKNLPTSAAAIIKISDAYKTSQKLGSKKFKCLVRILSDIVRYDKKGDLGSAVLTEFDRVTEALRPQLQACLPESGVLNLGNMWSVLDLEPTDKKSSEASSPPKKEEEVKHWELISSTEENRVQSEGLERLKKKWFEFFKNFITIIKVDSEVITTNLLKPEMIGVVQPYILLLTGNQFSKFDRFVLDTVERHRPASSRGDSAELVKFRHELLSRTKEKLTNIGIPKTKLERDELREDFERVAEIAYRRLRREQESVAGAWQDKRRDKEYVRLFAYVHDKYQKMMDRCPLSRHLKNNATALENTFNEFVALSSGRDKLGRAMRLKRHDGITANRYMGCNFAYVRQFVLKKFMLLSLLSKEQKGAVNMRQLFDDPFDSEFMRKLFTPMKEGKKESSTSLLQDEVAPSATPSIAETATPESGAADSGSYPISSAVPIVGPDEYIPKKVKPFDAEMITIRGAIFGRLKINSISLSFKTEKRKHGAKYRFGSTIYNQANEDMDKRWPLDSIKEVIVKRYNMLRQAVEIYFTNSKSVFFCLFRRYYLKKFLESLAAVLQKNPQLNVSIVTRPEAHFAEKKFRDRWVEGGYTNFEYLMLLNKYSGRSFNDLSQYPVFPWVIKDYDSDTLIPSIETIYRPLDTTIAAISPNKKRSADEKLSILIKEKELSAYQFGSHYLPGRVVLGYMLRLEPYASLLLNFEKGHDATARMFHFMKQAWLSCVNDIGDNKELIPEFYYLPEMFANYNLYQFGWKEADDELPELILKGRRVKVDQVVLPPWAKTSHILVQINATALESRYVSSNLDKWIDLIFGYNQQDSKFYNTYKELCDEAAIGGKIERLTESQLTEIQEFGINPMRMFIDKHPQKNEKVAKSKTQYALFTDSVPSEDRRFALLKMHNFSGQAVTFIEAYERRVITVLNTQKLYRTKEGYINVAHEKSVVFDKKELSLFPYKKLYNEAGKSYNCDAQRCFVSLDNGNYLLTCRHYDNSCKLVNLNTGDVEQTLYFHKSMVNAIAATESKDWVFTASNDGVVAAWMPKRLGYVRPVWYACDHEAAVPTLDACEKLDVVASGSTDGSIAIRSISSGKLLRVIRPNLFQRGTLFEISHVRVSYRGYVIIIAKCKNRKSAESDYLMTFSLNGEEICVKQEKDVIYALLLDETGYQFVTGGKIGRLLKYDILTLAAGDLLEWLDEQQPNLEAMLGELLDNDTAITGMEMTRQEGCQQLLIGLSTGSFYVYKFSPRLIGSKIFETLQGII